MMIYICIILKDQNRRLVDEEKKQRQELSEKFHSKIEEITGKMEGQVIS
jgi:hypothetical protein